MKAKWKRFWVWFFELLIIRPIFLKGSTGVYRITVTEPDATMHFDPLWFRHTGTCKTYEHSYYKDTLFDANNVFEGIMDNHIVPWTRIVLEHRHLWKGWVRVTSIKW